jgi:HD-GYP domain-containing protein (c-di-GMP phosphodiesterase class II)
MSKPLSPAGHFLGLQRVKVPVAELTIGMFVAELDRPWIDSPFLVQGFLLLNQDDIRRVRDVCEYVYIDVIKERAPADAKGGTFERTRYVSKVSATEEGPRAMDTYSHAKAVLEDMYESVRISASFNTDVAKSVVKDCVNSVIANPQALLWLTLIKNQDNYTAEHSLNVCVLAVALGREVGLLELELENLGLSGLLHDLGKARVPLEILNKEGALTPSEYEQMKQHTVHGRNLLLGKKGVFSGCIDVAFNHHERLNGQGYPRGLQARQLDYFTRIVAIVDAYDAITSARCYSAPKSSFEALRILKNAAGTHFDTELVVAFIRLIGLFPAGSLAELSSGEVGIVLPSGANQNTRPRVLVVRGPDKQPTTERMVDLLRLTATADCKEYKIVGLHPDGTFGVFLREYRTRGLKLGA